MVALGKGASDENNFGNSGPGASGKSTLTRVLCGAAAKEYVHPVLREKYAVGNGFAVPGTLKNGSDSISVMATRAALVLQLLARPDVGYVILDGVRSSYRWDVAWVRTQPVAALYVYFDISLEENQRRLLARRRANGKQEATLPPKTYQNMLAFRARAKSVFTAAQPADSVILAETDLPAQAAKKVQKALMGQTARKAA